MKRLLRAALLVIAGLVVIAGGAYGYFLYTPAAAEPHLSGQFTRHVLRIGGRERRYLLYRPAGLPSSAPLLLALHGSDGSAADLRRESGYAFDRLADHEHLLLAYPEAVEGNWNACNRVGDYAANRLGIDDVAFLTALARRIAGDSDGGRRRAFAVGISRGGQMAYRLALEAPASFAAVAAVAASLPAPGNFKCRPAPGTPPRLMIINGTDDPLNPFAGGEVSLFGQFKRGHVLSSRATADFFARRGHVMGGPVVTHGPDFTRERWPNGAVELLAIKGGGHALPQPWQQARRLLGRTVTTIDGAEQMWAFFAQSR